MRAIINEKISTENQLYCTQELKQKSTIYGILHQRIQSKSRAASELKQVNSAGSTCNEKSTDSLQHKQVDSGVTTCSNKITDSKRLVQLTAPSYSLVDRPKKDAQFLLLMHEQKIESLNSTSQVSINGASANNASNKNTERRYQRGGSSHNRNGSRGKGRGGRYVGRRLYCQLCTKPGHHAFQCYHIFDQHFQRPNHPNSTSNTFNQAFVGQTQQFYNQGNPTPIMAQQDSPQSNFSMQANYNQTSAYIATPNSVNDLSWYVDSGATNYITSD
ncbi:hypothetical protein ACOSP7_006817 [Xanthoceras sorbifolium]